MENTKTNIECQKLFRSFEQLFGSESIMDVVIIAPLLYSQLCVEEKILTQLPF